MLAIDLDPQDGGTLYDAIRYEDPCPLRDIVRPTYFTNLHIIPGNLNTVSDRSDDRFQAAFTYLDGVFSRRREAAIARMSDAVPIYAADGLPLGNAKRGPNFLTLKLRLGHTEGFEDWLLENIPYLLRDWQSLIPQP